MQKSITELTSEIASKELGTKVEIGKVDFGLLNRLVADDVVIYDLNNDILLKSARLSIKVEPADIINGIVSINSLQLYATKVHLHKKCGKSNYQFLIDKLQSNKNSDDKSVKVQLKSFVIRRGNITYDDNDAPATKGKFNTKHINISRLSANVKIKHFDKDSLDINIRKISLSEHSGLDLNKLSLDLKCNKNEIFARNLTLELPHTHLEIKNSKASYRFANNKIDLSSLKVESDIDNTYITPSDLKCFIPALEKFDNRIFVRTSVYTVNNSIKTKGLQMSSANGDLSIYGNLSYRHADIGINITKLYLSSELIKTINNTCCECGIKLPGFITNIGNMNITGDVLFFKNEKAVIRFKVATDTGVLSVAGSATASSLNLNLNADNLDVKRISGNKAFGNANGNAEISGNIVNGQVSGIKLRCFLKDMEVNRYKYENVNVEGSYDNDLITAKASIDDKYFNATFEGELSRNKNFKDINLTAAVNHIYPQKTNLTDYWGDCSLKANINSNVTFCQGRIIQGDLNISDLNLFVDKQHIIKKISANIANTQKRNLISMKCDFGEIYIHGNYDYKTIPNSILNILKNKIPSLNISSREKCYNNTVNLNATIYNTNTLNHFFKVPFSSDNTITLLGKLDEANNHIFLYAAAPNLSYKNHTFKNSLLNINTIQDTLICNFSSTKINAPKQDYLIKATTKVAESNILALLELKDSHTGATEGTVKALTSIIRNDDNSNTAIVNIAPSRINLSGKEWNISPSSLTINKKNVKVENFIATNDKQQIHINGTASQFAKDSLIISLKNTDLGSILKTIKFKAVSFDGFINGRINISSPFGSLKADGDLEVETFKFEGGDFGKLYAKAKWINSIKQIDIDAIALDTDDISTDIKGFVSLKDNEIKLDINANGTRLDFLKSFTKDFLDNTTGNINGNIIVGGPLSRINLTGKAVVNGKTRVRATNCTYNLNNDTIVLVPDTIKFRNATLSDKDNNTLTLNGELKHSHLTNLTYDLAVSTRHALLFDTKDLGNDPFYGTVYGAGTIDMQGRRKSTKFDIVITPTQNSVFTYNLSNPDAITNQEFIQWKSSESISAANKKTENANAGGESDLFINMYIDATSQATLRLLMDSETNDYLTLNGNGVLNAKYYNKEAFNLFGTYEVTGGTYSMTIQNLLKKQFIFNNGGSIVFNGDPMNADLNLQAVHTVKGVSLSGLNINKSLSHNTIRVDCIMNIQGKPYHPVVSFDLDLPSVSTDEKQMIKSIINSKDEMNQQVVYLLGLGRFYPEASGNSNIKVNNQQSQTSLAMQGLLSGTISTQINNVINKFVKNDNWNFGANISTGNEGWYNAEYEGQLSGKLLNSRLLVNGQFGYRDNATTTEQSFIGNFDIQYQLIPNGNISLKVFNQTNDKYFSKSSLNTQGVGLIMKKDFNNLKDILNTSKKKKKRNGLKNHKNKKE